KTAPGGDRVEGLRVRLGREELDAIDPDPDEAPVPVDLELEVGGVEDGPDAADVADAARFEARRDRPELRGEGRALRGEVGVVGVGDRAVAGVAVTVPRLVVDEVPEAIAHVGGLPGARVDALDRVREDVEV